MNSDSDNEIKIQSYTHKFRATLSVRTKSANSAELININGTQLKLPEQKYSTK